MIDIYDTLDQYPENLFLIDSVTLKTHLNNNSADKDVIKKELLRRSVYSLNDDYDGAAIVVLGGEALLLPFRLSPNNSNISIVTDVNGIVIPVWTNSLTDIPADLRCTVTLPINLYGIRDWEEIFTGDSLGLAVYFACKRKWNGLQDYRSNKILVTGAIKNQTITEVSHISEKQNYAKSLDCKLIYPGGNTQDEYCIPAGSSLEQGCAMLAKYVAQESAVPLYVFIDESGQFNNADNSVVGGLITKLNSSQIAARLNHVAEQINQEYRTGFNIDDIHTAALLHPESAYKEDEKARFTKISKDARDAFVQECLNVADTISMYYIKGANTIEVIGGNQNEQSRYGGVLLSLVDKICHYATENLPNKTINFFIAPRGKKCLPPAFDFNAYHQRLMEAVKKWAKIKYPALTMSFGYGCKHAPGFNMADVCCYFLRNGNKLDQRKILTAIPSPVFVTSYEQYNGEYIEQLIAQEAYETAYIHSDIHEKQQILNKIKNATLEIQLVEYEKLLNYASNLVAKRELQNTALDEAENIYKSIIRVIDASEEKDDFYKLQLIAVEGLLSCVNHRGIKKEQDKLIAEYNKVLQQAAAIPYQVKLDYILKFKNKAYNQQFNDYNFQAIINDFKEAVDKRVIEVAQSGKDGLTGEMLGTIGQAFAFLSSASPEYAAIAEEYFEKSLTQFGNDRDGVRYTRMSINFLVTLHWMHGEIDKARAVFSRNNGFNINDSTGDWISRCISSKEGVAFDIMVLMRLIAMDKSISEKLIIQIEKFLHEHNINQHPYELIYKWLGVLYISRNNFNKAIEYLQRSIDLAYNNQMGFTVQTLVLSSLGLNILCCKKLNNNNNAALLQLELRAKLKDLCDQSTSFAGYIEAMGGIKQMEQDIVDEDINAISKWLPFSYA